METLTTSTGSTSITTGSAFNTAFTDGVTITTGILADTSTFTYSGGLHAKDTSVTVDASSLVMNAAGEDTNITTGAGDDTVTFSGDATTVGHTTGAGGSLVISTGSGNDTISFAHGTLTGQTTDQFVTVTAGTGVDTISKTAGVNGTTVEAVTVFTFANGDSVVGAYDTISGFDLVENTGSLFGDRIDLATATVGTSIGSTDSGTIMSHSLANGKVSFDDVGTYAAAVVVNENNLDDVTGYLNANLGLNTTVIFEYDRDSNGTTDSTMVYSNLATADTLILLKDDIGAGLSATATLTTDEYVIIA